MASSAKRPSVLVFHFQRLAHAHKSQNVAAAFSNSSWRQRSNIEKLLFTSSTGGGVFFQNVNIIIIVGVASLISVTTDYIRIDH